MNLLNDPRAYQAQQAVRRATTATSILDVAAWIGMFASVLFWNNFFFTLTAPTGIIEMVLALAIAAGYAVVLPMLISLLAPSTPAGMALAETRWKTIGHAIAVAATLYMSFHAFQVLWAWWKSRPPVAAAGQDIFLAVGCLIIFVVVPALSWVQIAPDRWVAEVIQAQQVRRLRAAQQANIMAAQLQYARAMALLKRGLANATAGERAELAGTLIAMQRAENEAITQVADSMRLLTGIDTGVKLLDDPQIEEHFHALTGQVERLFAPINDVDYVELPPAPAVATTALERRPSAVEAYAPSPARSTVAHQDADPAVHGRPHPSVVAVRSGPPRTAVARDRAAVSTAAAVRPELTGAWARRQLEEAASCEKSKATELIRTWRDLGLIDDITQPANHYAWTDPKILTQRMAEVGL